VIAVLLHSLWDYTLAIPGLFWLFCYCAASAIPDSPRGVNIPSPYKPVAAALTLGLGLAVAGAVLAPWAAQRALVGAEASLEQGRFAEARGRLETSGRLNPFDAERPLLAAAVELREAPLPSQGLGPLLAAAAALEEAVTLNPYRPATWSQLAVVYRAMGRGALAADAERRAARHLPSIP
jgi:tetratricopeptide (TPR) repeat protein